MTPRDPNPPARAPRRTKDDVVDAALRLLDGVGLPDLSMRRLADELGVQPSALYWHVASKQELLAAVSGRILAPVVLRPGDPVDLAGAAVTLGHRLHDRLLAHRDGAEVRTIEGMANADGSLSPIQAAFQTYHGLQCGFCTPGMVMAAAGLLKENADPSEAEIRDYLEGNICRCTGYHNIVRAIQAAAAELAAKPLAAE